MNNPKYCLTCSYQIEKFFVNSTLDRVIQDLAGYSDGSGAGFGSRDHSWYGLTRSEAEAKADILRGLDVEISIQEENDYE
jgi:hypothetical protein